MGLKLTPQQFKKEYGTAFVLACKDTNLFPSVKLAQAALETEWGKHVIGIANNMFGMKASGNYTPFWRGDFVSANTKEDFGSGQVPVYAKFRKYRSLNDSILDHSYLLNTSPRYAPVRNARTPEEQCMQLQACGYATAQNYASSLISIINNNQLKEFDKKKD